MRGLWSTVGLVAAAVGLGAYIYFVDSERPATEVKEKVFTLATDDVEELRVTAKGETSLLRKRDGVWKLVEPLETDADASEVSSLLGSLTTLEVNREVDPNASNLAEYGLASPKTDITFKAKDGKSGRVRLGDTTPTNSDLYAVAGDGNRVFLVSTFVDTSMSRSTFDLRDKKILRFERDKADGLEITTGAGTTVMTRANSEWRLTAPSNARGDYGAIEGLLTRLSTTSMQAIESSDVSDLAKYGLDKPDATVVVKAGSAAASLAVSAEKDGKVYARDLSRSMVFTIDTTAATDLKKGGNDYRKKELFEFRAFSAKRIVVTRGAETITFAKVAGTGENAADKWTIATGGSTRDADTAKMDDLLSKLTNLRSEEFVAAAPAAAGPPVLRVSAEFDESKKDEASIGRSGVDTFGSRADEPGAMKLATSAVDEALTALDAVLAPPAPAAPTPPAAPAAGVPPEKKP
jgi:Domain of unknown function (DUF4340)